MLIKIPTWYLLAFLLCAVMTASAQERTFLAYYQEQLNSKNLTTDEKAQLVDSLLQIPNLKVDQLELAEIYYQISAAKWRLNLKRSIRYAEKVLNIADELENYNEDVFVKTLYNKVLFLSTDKQLYKALNTSEHYLHLYKLEDKRLGKLYRLRGNMYSELGDIQQAIDNYDKSIFIFSDNLKELTKSYTNKLETYVALEDDVYSEAIKNIKEEIEHIETQYEIPASDKIIIYQNLGVFYKHRNALDTSFTYYEAALNISKKTDSSKVPFLLNNIAILHKRKQEYAVAKTLLLTALNIEGISYDLQAMIYNNLADIDQLENKHEEALIHYQKAITSALHIDELDYQRLPNFQDIELSPDKQDILGYLIDKANGWIAYYEAAKNDQYLEYALETFTLADRLIDIIYKESREDLSKLFWRKRGAKFYPKAVEVCYRLQQPEKAFFFMEKNKAMVLLENITNASAKRLSKLPQKMLVRERNLIKKIKMLESEIQEYTTSESQKADSLKNTVFGFKNQYNAFLDSLEITYPKYYAYKKNINIVTLKEVQKNLQKNELILHYIVGQEHGFVMLISAKKIQLAQLPNTATLTNIVAAYKNAVSKPFVNAEDKKVYEKVATQLFQQLIPFAEKTRLSQTQITIIADGILQYIPFEALRTAANTYLIEEAQIQYNYSLSSALQLQQNTAAISQDFIAIAPTTFKNDAYSTLATSTTELEKLSAIFNGNHFQHEKAIKKRFTEAYGNYKIIHLSTHGGVHKTTPWLAFYDEKMTLDELYFTRNQSDLIVLSACKTSDGELKKGEGVMSLARGFFNAGAKSVIASLWDINEKASNEIIQEFYKNSVAGDTKSAALQKAKLTYIQNHNNTSEASPYYWSALTLTGDIRPVEFKRNSYLYYILGGIILTGMVLFIRFKRNQKQVA